jgi:protein-S-isoprenylcysteine O-methyltransferase Ste14
MEKESKATGNNIHKNKVHHVLAHSYTVYFILFLIGLSLDLIFGYKIFTDSVMAPVGIALIIFSSLLIIWAQKSSRKLEKESLTKESFSKGPYRHARHPTYWGLFLLLFGFGIMVNATFIILSTMISIIVSKTMFMDKEEKILAEKYGEPYLEYKKSVKI